MSDDDIRNQTFIPGQSDNEKTTGKLKEPRDLYSTASLQHIPKWPIECQVIPERIRHIDVPCHKLESFYTPNSAEIQPKPVGEEMGTVIFNYSPKLSVDYFCRSCAGGSEELQFFETDANTLKFESRFESGNLAKVIKVTNVYYELYLRPDMYTDRHSQWFYFRIQNTKENVTYRFSIVNLNKPDSLYRYGLKPLIYSEKEAQLNNHGWMRCGQNISYYKNDLLMDDNNSFYTLTFNLRFRHSNDTIYIAQCYPYTYSRLQSYLAGIEANETKSELCQQRLLCRSLAGNNIYVLTITSPDNYLEENLKKPAVVISARVHPAETQSSYMMKGIIDFLTSNASQAKDLRDRFIFKLIPMLNPDGVIVGNSRCCLLGQDLNRQYRTVLREAFPQIYHTKVMLRRLNDENGIFLYCDLHGHSRRNNVFMYGCENKRIPEKRLIEQVFPLMMHKNASDKFSFQNCKFKIQRSKEGTGRVFAWTLGVDLSYTLEVSLGGSTLPSRQHTHFNTYDYEGIGRHFCETLLDYSDTSPAKEKMKERILQKLLEAGSNADEPLNIPLTDYSSLSHSDSDDSDDGDEAEEGESEKKMTKSNSASIRRQSSTRSLKKIKPRQSSTLKIERSVMSLSKATVDYVRTGQKYRRLDENSDKNLDKEKEKDKEHDCMTRLSKFRRRSRRVSFSVINEKQGNANTNVLSTKCTSILFDDPFKPPDKSTAPLTAIKSFPFGNDETGVMEVTEDECDDCDGAFKNQKYLPEDIPSLDIAHELADELALLQLSPNTIKLDVERNVSPAVTTTATSPTISLPVPAPIKSRLKPVPTPAHDQSVYNKSERKTRATLQKQEAIRRDSIFAKLNTMNEQNTKRHSFSSTLTSSTTAATTTTTTTVVTRHSLSASKERLEHVSASLVSSAGNKSVFTLAQSQSLSRRRVSWTGISVASPFQSIKAHRGSVGFISLNTTGNNGGGGGIDRKDGTHTKSPKTKTLKKSKSMGDKVDETTSHSSSSRNVFHGHCNTHGVAGMTVGSTKKKKSKLKRTKSRK